MTEAVLELKNVSKKFGKFEALKDVNFSIAPGEVFGFIGPNGAGKSTTIRAILGLLKLSQGEIKLFNESAEKDVKHLHQRIAYVPGDVYLWPNLTGGEVIDLLLKMGGHQHTQKTDELIKRFDLDPKKKARTYSKGNRQKVALIAAFSADVDFYIFDEPTSGLDPLQERNFQDAVLELKKAGKSVLLSSHILSEVEKMVDKLAIIRHGEIIQSGTLSELQQLGNLNVKATLSDPALLDGFVGIDNLKLVEEEATFTVKRDNLSALLARLSEAKVTDLAVSAPTLEDIFMAYYEQPLTEAEAK
ncbi:MAG: ABC transporter ATP-binding protein [Lactobacillaceae bacterium]|jgi:ABC-2 type transport system ATP-binding protein|nr:ABC transporter ATP-binding protein [Lactobacillaceae bacterium]